MSGLLREALRLVDEGLCVVPVAPGKKHPAVPWSEFQKRRPTDDEVDSWFGDSSVYGLGIITGRISGVTVLDVDPRHGGEESLRLLEGLPSVPTVVTGSGGMHFYFNSGDGPSDFRNSAGRMPGLDVRAEGGFLVAPPTRHPVTGRSYVWVSGECSRADWPAVPRCIASVFGDDLRRCGTSVVERPPRRHGPTTQSTPLAAPREGGRNDACARETGRLIRRGLRRVQVEWMILLWNESCVPPMRPEECLRVVDNIYASRERRCKNQQDFQTD